MTVYHDLARRLLYAAQGDRLRAQREAAACVRREPHLAEHYRAAAMLIRGGSV